MAMLICLENQYASFASHMSPYLWVCSGPNQKFGSSQRPVSSPTVVSALMSSLSFFDQLSEDIVPQPAVLKSVSETLNSRTFWNMKDALKELLDVSIAILDCANTRMQEHAAQRLKHRLRRHFIC